MKIIITAVLIFMAFYSKGQTITIGQNWYPGMGNKYEAPIFDTSKAIVIYLDGLNVKADSCFVYKTATEYTQIPCPSNVMGCLVYHTGPAWDIIKVVGYSKKTIDLKSIIQYK